MSLQPPERVCGACGTMLPEPCIEPSTRADSTHLSCHPALGVVLAVMHAVAAMSISMAVLWRTRMHLRPEFQ